MNIVQELSSILARDAGALAVLKEHGVVPEAYAAFVFDDELRRSRRVGLAVGFMLTLGLFLLAYFASAESVATAFAQLSFGLGGAALGILIAWGTFRRMEGKRWKYLDEPDETSSGFHLLGMVSRLDTKSLKKLDEKTWAWIRLHKFDLNAKRYERLPTEPKTQTERAKLMRMTPRKEALVARLGRVKRWSVYAMLLVILVPFTENLFFLFWLWFFVGVWLALEAVEGVVKRYIGVFSETTTVDLYGWPARVFAWFVLFLALVIFITPGLLGMSATLGFDLMDAIFS